MRRGIVAAAVALGSAVAIAAVVTKARRDSADPARCAGLVPLGNRCCAEGQALAGDRCVGRPSRCPPPLAATDAGCVAMPATVAIAGGAFHAGAGDWEAEGRIAPHGASLAAFRLDVFEITETAYGECMGAGACPNAALSGEPGRALGGLTFHEASAYCVFRGGRLPTEDEWTLAAGGTKPRRYPWGDTGAVCRRAAWGLHQGPCGFGFTGPELAGAHPDGASPDGIHDLSGNVAEWVSAPGGAAVRGGSFATALATELRTWHARAVAPGTRAPEIGGRCAYDAERGVLSEGAGRAP